MNKFIRITIFILCVSFLAGLPFLVEAGIVPCGQADTPKCQFCHTFVLIRNIITIAAEVVIPLALVFVGIGGIMILTAGDSAEQAVKGKKAIRLAGIGVIIAFAAWFIINSAVALLANPRTFPLPWNAWRLDCPILVIESSESRYSTYSITSDISPSGPSPGDTVRYSLTYTNSSSQRLSNLVISSDYDQNHITSIISISNNGVDTGDIVIWDIGDLDAGQSVTVSYNFILATDLSDLLSQGHKSSSFFTGIIEKILKSFIKPALGQINSPFRTVYIPNIMNIISDQTQDQTFNDPIEVRIVIGLIAERKYYLTGDFDRNGRISVGDGLRYNIEYFSSSDFNNVVVISDYDEDYIDVESIDGGGVDDGDRVVWNLGNLHTGQPSPNNLGCLGYNFSVSSVEGVNYVPSIFVIVLGGIASEVSDDRLNIR